jgi:hypothetical protein
MFGMSSDQILALIRQILPVLGGIAVTFGWLTPGQVETTTATVLSIAGPALIIASTIWSVVAHTQANTLTSAAAIPNVKTITLDPMVAGTSALVQATPANVKSGP